MSDLPPPSPFPPHRGDPADTPRVLADAVRLAALAATDITTSARADALRPFARLTARALRVPIAQINVLTADAQVPVVAYAPGDPDPSRWERAVGLDQSFCKHVVAAGTPVIIEDARTDDLVRTSRAAIEAGVVAYAGAPVRAPASLGPELGGQVLGTVCAVDVAPRRWTADDVALLEDLAEAITAELALRADAATTAAAGVAAAAAEALRRADADRAASEERFRTLADSIPQLAWMADADGSIVWYNQRWYDYTGSTPAAMLGEGWTAVHHPDHVEGVRVRFRAAVAARLPWEDLFPLRGRDGRYRWFLSRALPVPDARGDGVRWVGTNTDVTERMEAEAERERLLRAEREARMAAEEAGRARTRFLATMSHELRTPLNAIGGYTELLDLGLRGAVTDAQRADLARIRRSQQHLLGLINDVLNFARLESGTVRFATEDVGVAMAVQDVSAMILPQAASKGLSYRMDPMPPTLAVRADREKLGQVLLNLLSNAVKFTPAPGRVTVGCDADADTVRVIVRDTGVGIPDDKRDAVFEPFVQVHAGLTRNAEGAGLGLAISRDLARGMQGDLTLVASEADGGSTFVLSLPRAADLPADAAAPVPEVGTVAAEAAARGMLDADGANGASRGGARDVAGVHEVLRYLNARTSHRFTGLYRFDGAVLRNVALFDRERPDERTGDDSPLDETYCAIVGATQRTFATDDARDDARTADHPARESVVSYCGALVRADDGTAIGTLCSFDVEPRPVPTHEIPLLEAVAPLLAPAVQAHAPASNAPASNARADR